MKNTLIALTFALGLTVHSENWNQFRGRGNGVSTDENLPPLCRTTTSRASPCLAAVFPALVLGDHVIVTRSSGPTQSRLHVLALNAKDGSVAWHRQFWATGRTMCHAKTSVAAPTSCSDGKNIYAVFSSNDVICLDRAGNSMVTVSPPITPMFPTASA